jgi:hypothetical protein
MAKAATTKIEVFTNKEDICVTGRLLGLIHEKEMFALLNNKSFQRKTFSKPTISVSDVGKATEELHQSEDVRLVLAVKTLDDEATNTKTLFISDKLDFVTQTLSPTEITINGKKDVCMFIEETEA